MNQNKRVNLTSQLAPISSAEKSFLAICSSQHAAAALDESTNYGLISASFVNFHERHD